MNHNAQSLVITRTQGIRKEKEVRKP